MKTWTVQLGLTESVQMTATAMRIDAGVLKFFGPDGTDDDHLIHAYGPRRWLEVWLEPYSVVAAPTAAITTDEDWANPRVGDPMDRR